MITLIVILAILVIIIIWAISLYNSIIALNNKVKEAWSDVDVQLKRRHDLIPNLIASVKGYQKHERGILEDVTQLRSQAMSAKSIVNKAQAEAGLSMGLGKLFAIAENYPDLKASNNFINLQNNLSEIENNIQNARRYYNGVTRDYNIKIQSFPQSLVAQMLHFQTRDFFELDASEEKEVPQVEF